MPTIALLAGARPNYMKIFPLWRELREHHPDLMPRIIHTGQHYDALMSDIFFSDLGMPAPDHFLGVGSGSHGEQTARVMMALDALFDQYPLDLLVVVGDVNSTMAGALTAVKRGLPIAHMEAGLRSGDRAMPEEINRIVTDAISDMLLTPSPDADAHLLREGIPAARIYRVGNIMVDSLLAMLPRAEESTILARENLQAGNYVAVTLHRPSNVDDPASLARLVQELNEVAEERGVVFPVHPRTRKMLVQEGLDRVLSQQVRLLDPVGYIDFLRLQKDAFAVVTDSGGIQEETTVLGVPCITLRPNTERPITVTEGTNVLLNREQESLVESVRRSPERRGLKQIDGWDGRTAARAVRVLRDFMGWSV